VANACPTAGRSCLLGAVTICAEDADGCLVATTEACGNGEFCDAGECTGCDDLDNACDEAGAACDGETLVACEENADGCLVETSTDCSDDGYCDEDAQTPECVACEDVDDACDDEGVSCDGTDLVTCAENDDGCLVAEAVDCTDDEDNNFCDDEPTTPVCAYEPCRTDEGELKEGICVDTETICADDFLIECVDDGEGCFVVERTDCTMDGDNNVCDDEPATPVCAFDPCIGVTDCLVAGDTCVGNAVVTCGLNEDGCLVLSTPDACEPGFTCDPETTECVECTDDPQCAEAENGDVSCVENVLSTCADPDGDTCLNLIEEDCGDDFACDAESEQGCVFDGEETCVEDVVETIRASGPYGEGEDAYTTTGETSNWGPFAACPLAFDPMVTGPDLLFAVDVPAESVIVISLAAATGFTSTPWLFITTDCLAASEATCRAGAVGTVEYTNTTNVIERVYLVVDASNTDNVGSFGLTVETRALVCGDGERDGAEACDDGNIFDEDGCSPECELEDGYECTEAEPSVCTSRPDQDEPSCGNVMCEAFPDGTAATILHCCTTDATCGVAYDPAYGATCIERADEEPVDNEACPQEAAGIGLFFGFPPLDGCCRAVDGQCGLTAGVGLGCVLRSDAWAAMQDGAARFFYDGPFMPVSCDD
jgi:hypothetical protein